MNAFMQAASVLVIPAIIVSFFYASAKVSGYHSYLGVWFPPKEQREILAKYESVREAKEKSYAMVQLADRDPHINAEDLGKLKTIHDGLREHWSRLYDELQAAKAKNTHKPRKYQKFIEDHSEYTGAG